MLASKWMSLLKRKELHSMDRHYPYFWPFLLLSFSILGCSVGPKYTTPEMELPCEWQSDHCEELVDEPVDSLRWWELLNDPMLNCLIERAASQNLDLHIAMTRILEARLAQKGGEGSFYPHLDGSVSYSYASFNQRTLNDILGYGRRNGTSQRNVNLFEVGFDAEWEIDLFGMNAHQNKALSAQTEASQEDFSNVWVTLSAEVARYYIELRGFQQRLEVINRDIEAQADTQELTKSLIVGGFAGSVDQAQADEELNLVKAQKPQLEFMIHKNIYHLSVLLGYLPGDLFCLLSTPEALPLLPCRKPIGVPSELLRRRPDIRKAERDLAAATEEVGTAIAALFPRISLTGFIGDITTFCTTGSLTGFVGPQLLLPIFNSKMLKQDVCLNKIKVEQALFQYQKTVLEALEETETAIAAFHYEMEKNHHLENVRTSSQNAYILSLQLYQNGLKNYLEVQTAHRSFLAAENAALQSQVDLLVNYISLYKSLGGGWEVLPCELEE